MKYSGMIRKIDELGRIVIPKEIRKSINIHDGEELEFIIDRNTIILKKNNSLFSNINLLVKMVNNFGSIFNIDIGLSNLDKIVVSNNSSIIDMNLSKELIDLINNRESIDGFGNYLNVDKYYLINPIIIDGNCYGLFLLIGDDSFNENDIKVFNFFKETIVAMYEIS